MGPPSAAICLAVIRIDDWPPAGPCTPSISSSPVMAIAAVSMGIVTTLTVDPLAERTRSAGCA